MKENDSGRFNLSFILLTSVAAVFIYSYKLGEISFWIDEIQTTTYAQQSFREMIRLVSHKEACPPLYYIIVHIAHLLGADSQFTLRIPSLLLAFGSIVSIYYLAKELYGEREGIISALFLAISPLFIICARDARLYSFFIFASIALSLSFIKAIKHSSFRGWIIFTVILTLSFYGHYFTAFLAISQFIYLCVFFLLKKKQNAMKDFAPKKIFINFFASGFVAVLFFLPWISHLLTQITNRHENFVDITLFQKIKDVFYMTFFWFGGGDNLSAILICAIAFCGIFFSLKKTDSLLFIIINMAVPLSFILFYFLSINWIFQERYSSFLLPFFIILAGRSISELSVKISERLKNANANFKISTTRGIISGLIIAICFFLFFSVNKNILFLQKENWGGAAKSVQSEYGKKDFLTGLPPWSLWCVAKYGAFDKGEREGKIKEGKSNIYVVRPYGSEPPPILKKFAKDNKYNLVSSYPGWNPINIWRGEFLYSPLNINFTNPSSAENGKNAAHSFSVSESEGKYGKDIEFRIIKKAKKISSESQAIDVRGIKSIIISGRATVSHYSIRPVFEAEFFDKGGKLVEKKIINPMAFLTGDFTYFGWYRKILDLKENSAYLKFSFTIPGNLDKGQYCIFRDMKAFGLSSMADNG